MPESKKDKEDKTTESREQRLFEQRTLFLSEAVSSKTAQKFVSDLLALSQKNDPIYLYINSPGGEVNSGFAIYDTIRFIPAPVTIINAGLCASIATIINIAVPAERRFSLKHTEFLIHQPLIGGEIFGVASDIEITAKQINHTRERINKLLAEACNQDVERISKDTQRDYWLDAHEAVDYGLIGKVVDSMAEIK